MCSLPTIGVIVASVVSLVIVAAVHTKVLNFAIRRNIVDNPNSRKLQREPVPVLGGVAVFMGIISGLCVASLFLNITSLMAIFVAMLVMLCMGVIDDVAGLSAWSRFVIEVAGTMVLILFTNTSLNDFHGLWGIDAVPLLISLPLTIVSVVGIINAVNLIDGVDGLSSGFCIMACIAFGLLFYKVDNTQLLLLSALSVGALLPFFFHNVFGKRSKMFIGDGGSLMMGMVMSVFVVRIISEGGYCDKCDDWGLGLVPYTLAVMSVPVFDAVRVMFMRILRRTSPFHPDKTHLHHLFVELGFSHVGTTTSVLLLNMLVMLAWWLTYRLGASVDVQFYVVIASGLLVTAGFYKFMRIQINRQTAIYRFMKRIGAMTQVEESKVWLVLQKIADYRFLK